MRAFVRRGEDGTEEFIRFSLGELETAARCWACRRAGLVGPVEGGNAFLDYVRVPAVLDPIAGSLHNMRGWWCRIAAELFRLEVEDGGVSPRVTLDLPAVRFGLPRVRLPRHLMPPAGVAGGDDSDSGVEEG